MPRTKNRGVQQSFSPSYTIRRWRLGEYIRLSKEDLKKGKDDSNSVKNQRDLLNDFYQKHIEEFESVSEYVDDGHTGTDANRENFQRLLADVMSGKINCVVVKDLSRFARNYSDAGSLIDNLFVQMGVRFISLAENVDSFTNPDSVSNIIVPITNVMNDNYCYQTSKKIRQVFDYKRRNGQYIGAFAPYGYMKHPKDKHKLIIDPDAAETVKLIFSLFLQGTSKRAIALYLNEHGVPSPSAYKLLKGLPVSTRGYDEPMWGGRMIHAILTNPTYTGDLAQGRSRVKSYKVHQIETVPREEWVEVAGTHEAIIDYETFDKVQALLKHNFASRARNKAKEDYLLSTKLFCGHCGSPMIGESGTSKLGRVYHYYKCSKRKRERDCSKKVEKKDWLEELVVRYTVHHVLTDENIELIATKAMELIEKDLQDTSVLVGLQGMLKDINKKIKNLMSAIEQGIITSSTKERLEELELERLNIEGQIAREEMKKPLLSKERIVYWLTSFKSGDIQDIEYQRRIIDTLVNSVFVYDDDGNGRRIVLTFNISGNNTLTIECSDIEGIAP